MSTIGHNSDGVKKKVSEILTEYSASLKRSQEENDLRAELREKAKELGFDTKALQNAIAWAKSSLKQRDGYDESLAFFKSLVAEEGGAATLFKWVVDREAEKEKERDEARKARDNEKAKADEFKAAPDRKPKPAPSGKDAAAGEKEE